MLKTGHLLIIAFMVGPRAVQPLAAQATSPGSASERDGGYVGSAACAGCHTKIFETWRATRHGDSVLTGDEAKRAGYPLPQRRRGGVAPAVQTWEDVSYVIGGRQRITYADRSGRIEETSYHHRLGRWSAFPATELRDCGACHFTGFGSGPAHPDDAAIPGRWAERNIGCEACHGPGKRHVETYDREDIVVDPSSRACGVCHTGEGRVLPVDDLHDTHDLVQNWNGDPHVTGVRFHSHNAFCSRCHSPYEGHFLESRRGASRRVFTEQKQNITCIACHDPHDLTNPHYRPGKVSLDPPRASRRQTYSGNDRDFTTTDFKNHASTEEVCVECHKGADRIDLDHAGATCNDCHNTFVRNRGVESRMFHDARHRALSCRPCHRDADHLITIVFEDPDFLQPRSIHDLRTLPSEVVSRYAFKYPGTRRPITSAKSEASIQPEAGRPADPRAVEPEAEAEVGLNRGREGVRELLERAPHRGAQADDAIATARALLAAAPGSIARCLELADAYARRAEYAAAHDTLRFAAALDTTRVLLELPFDGPTALAPGAPDRSARALSEQLLPSARVADAGETRTWLEGYLDMTQGRFEEAARTFAAARELHSSDALDFHLGLAELGRRNNEEAVAALRRVLEKRPDHLGARVALGYIELRRNRLNTAREELLRAVTLAPDDPVANYLLGHGYLNGADAPKAIELLRATIAADPSFIDARFALAEAYRLGGRPGEAAQSYREIIGLAPGQFEAHFRLAGLLKEQSDQLALRVRADSEAAPPSTVRPDEWRLYLAELQARSRQYGRFALSEFIRALGVRPHDLESIRQVGEIHRASGRRAEALKVFEWLSRRQSGVWQHPYREGTLLLENREHGKAIAALERALALSRTQGDTYFALGLAYAQCGRLADAVETFRRGLIYEPFNPGLQTNLGAALAMQGRLSAARRALERALELRTFPLPRTHLTLTNLALVHLREKRYEDAVPRLKEALHIFPEYAYARRLLDALTTTKHESGEGFDEEPFVFNDDLEIFGEVSTIAFGNE